MKTLIPLVLAAIVLSPVAAFAGAATDAALGLGAFAVFNQIVSGTGVFGVLRPAPAVVVQPAPVHYAPAPVYVAAPPVYVAPPPPVYVVPRPVYVAPRHVIVHHRPGHVVHVKHVKHHPHGWRRH
jgi:hypothetical protein